MKAKVIKDITFGMLINYPKESYPVFFAGKVYAAEEAPMLGENTLFLTCDEGYPWAVPSAWVEILPEGGPGID